MTLPPTDPVRLCALADLVLLTRDLLRRPDPSASVPGGDTESLDGLLAAAGGAAGSALDAALRRVVALTDQTDPDAWQDEHHRLFEGATLCPLNQTAYIRRDKGVIIGDLCGFYRAFGFASTRNTGEKPDHLLSELEFLAILLVMLAQARGDDQQTTRSALTSFAQDHLCDWIGAVSERLAMVTSLPYYAAVADALRETWTHLSEQLALPPGQALAAPADAPMQSEPEDPYQCGAVAAAEQVEMRVEGDPTATPLSGLHEPRP